MENLPQLILASQSPRRRQILEALGVEFDVLISSALEGSGTASQVAAIVMQNAFAKASEVASRVTGEAVVLGADTVVVLDDAILGKPADEEEARRMLRALSGRPHSVVTGMALVSSRYGERRSFVRTEIQFKPLSSPEIEDYLKSVEAFDKAGAYGIQGLASLFVARVDGSYTNVMGLPIEQLILDLPALTGIAAWRWVKP